MRSANEFDRSNLPKHVAIIMDGNGRWAKQRGLPRVMGHRAGTKTVKKIVTAAREIGIQVLTLYAFSTENWKRPAQEVRALMKILKSFLKAERSTMLRNNIVLRSIGQVQDLPADVLQELRSVAQETAEQGHGKECLILNLALNYGGRAEIVRAAKIMAEKCLRGEIDSNAITEESFSRELYTADSPDPDLIIRTGGESRLSNFLLWQASYAELCIIDVKWPDFSEGIFLQILADFQRRERRFGKTGEQVQVP